MTKCGRAKRIARIYAYYRRHLASGAWPTEGHPSLSDAAAAYDDLGRDHRAACAAYSVAAWRHRQGRD